MIKQTSIWFLLFVLLSVSTGCQWIAVTYSALNYPETGTGQSANVSVVGATAYGTLGEAGFEVVNLTDPEVHFTVSPPFGTGSIDDIAAADGFLFTLDAREPGYLSVFSAGDSGFPSLVSEPVEVGVGPFSGVSAGNGRVIVSGGTSSLVLFAYDEKGRLSAKKTSIDLGRGQPDVLVSPDGNEAFVSTHHIGPYFGLTALAIRNDSLSMSGGIDLDTYGFTEGGAKPANFPIEAALVGKTLLVAHAAGLAVVAVDDSSQLKLVTVLELGIKAVNVDAFEQTAAVVGSSPNPTLVLLDVTHPMTPVIRQTVSLPEGTYPTSVSIGPEYIVVAGHDRGLIIYHHHKWSLSTGKESL